MFSRYKNKPKQRLNKLGLTRTRIYFLKGRHKFMMKCHCKLKFFKTAFDLLLYKLIWNGDYLQHLFHVVYEILEVFIIFDDLVNRKGYSSNSFSSHVECYLIFLWYKKCNMNKIADSLHIINHKFVLYPLIIYFD